MKVSNKVKSKKLKPAKTSALQFMFFFFPIMAIVSFILILKFPGTIDATKNVVISIDKENKTVSGIANLDKNLSVSKLTNFCIDSSFVVLDYAVSQNFEVKPKSMKINSENYIVDIKLNPDCKLEELPSSKPNRKLYISSDDYILDMKITGANGFQISGEDAISSFVKKHLNLFLRGEQNELYETRPTEAYYVYEPNQKFLMEKSNN